MGYFSENLTDLYSLINTSLSFVAGENLPENDSSTERRKTSFMGFSHKVGDDTDSKASAQCPQNDSPGNPCCNIPNGRRDSPDSPSSLPSPYVLLTGNGGPRKNRDNHDDGETPPHHASEKRSTSKGLVKREGAENRHRVLKYGGSTDGVHINGGDGDTGDEISLCTNDHPHSRLQVGNRTGKSHRQSRKTFQEKINAPSAFPCSSPLIIPHDSPSSISRRSTSISSTTSSPSSALSPSKHEPRYKNLPLNETFKKVCIPSSRRICRVTREKHDDTEDMSKLIDYSSHRSISQSFPWYYHDPRTLVNQYDALAPPTQVTPQVESQLNPRPSCPEGNCCTDLSGDKDFSGEERITEPSPAINISAKPCRWFHQGESFNGESNRKHSRPTPFYTSSSSSYSIRQQDPAETENDIQNSSSVIAINGFSHPTSPSQLEHDTSSSRMSFRGLPLTRQSSGVGRNSFSRRFYPLSTFFYYEAPYSPPSLSSPDHFSPPFHLNPSFPLAISQTRPGTDQSQCDFALGNSNAHSHGVLNHNHYRHPPCSDFQNQRNDLARHQAGYRNHDKSHQGQIDDQLRAHGQQHHYPNNRNSALHLFHSGKRFPIRHVPTVRVVTSDDEFISVGQFLSIDPHRIWRWVRILSSCFPMYCLPLYDVVNIHLGCQLDSLNHLFQGVEVSYNVLRNTSFFDGLFGYLLSLSDEKKPFLKYLKIQNYRNEDLRDYVSHEYAQRNVLPALRNIRKRGQDHSSVRFGFVGGQIGSESRSSHKKNIDVGSISRIECGRNNVNGGVDSYNHSRSGIKSDINTVDVDSSDARKVGTDRNDGDDGARDSVHGVNVESEVGGDIGNIGSTGGRDGVKSGVKSGVNPGGTVGSGSNGGGDVCNNLPRRDKAGESSRFIDRGHGENKQGIDNSGNFVNAQKEISTVPGGDPDTCDLDADITGPWYIVSRVVQRHIREILRFYKNLLVIELEYDPAPKYFSTLEEVNAYFSAFSVFAETIGFELANFDIEGVCYDGLSRVRLDGAQCRLLDRRIETIVGSNARIHDRGCGMYHKNVSFDFDCSHQGSLFSSLKRQNSREIPKIDAFSDPNEDSEDENDSLKPDCRQHYVSPSSHISISQLRSKFAYYLVTSATFQRKEEFFRNAHASSAFFDFVSWDDFHDLL